MSSSASGSAGSLRRRRPRATVSGVLGELLLTLGVLVGLFLVWQLWWNDAILGAQQSAAASAVSSEWMPDAGGAADTAEGAGSTETTGDDTLGDPVVASAPDAGESFAIMYVPRFGDDSQRTIATGVGFDVLNSETLGVGHYPSTQMPGAVGNFAIAAHRSAYGGGMHEIEQLRLGDAVYVQTADGWYTYRFRDLEYVDASESDVLAPVPHEPAQAASDRLITLTTCNPLYSTAERIVAYGVLESWRPADAGAPAEIADTVETWRS